MFIFYALLPYVCIPFLHWIKFCSNCFRQIFLYLGDKKVVDSRVRQVVVLYSNDCMGICLGLLSIVHLRLVVAFRGSLLNTFDCIMKL